MVGRLSETLDLTPMLDVLASQTSEFFGRHWPRGESVPQWSVWDLKDPMPHENSGGCYAVVEEGDVIYIGVTTKVNTGLKARLKRHVVRRDGTGYKAKHARWSTMTQIHLIPVPDPYRYLAASLEVFLIEQLKPRENWKRKSEA